MAPELSIGFAHGGLMTGAGQKRYVLEPAAGETLDCSVTGSISNDQCPSG
jgi:hypothetical protein